MNIKNIPDEALDAAHKHIPLYSKHQVLIALAAALNAWPDARMRTTFLPNDDGVWIVPQHMWSLPMTEASDDQ